MVRYNYFRRRLLFCSGCALLALLVLFVEENSYWGGFVGNLYGNFYYDVVYFEIKKQRLVGSALRGSQDKLLKKQANFSNIAVVVVMDKSADADEYHLSQSTLRCYCQYHDYPLLLINLEGEENQHEFTGWKKLCMQSDFMFRRHCVVAQLLRQRLDLEYIFFLDADIGVINPNHLLEEYIQNPVAELVFYERIFNYEVMAGSYIARRSNYTIEFLEKWAGYAYKLPNSFHGTDNGAIHTVLLDQVCPDCSPARRKVCERLWNTSDGYDRLSMFNSCARSVLGQRNRFDNGEIVFLTDPTAHWARDGWLTGNQWAPSDFMLHGWQRRRLDRVVFAEWHSPLTVPELNCPAEVIKSNVYKNWAYKDSFVKTDDFVANQLRIEAMNTHQRHLSNLGRIDKELMGDFNK